MKYTQSGTLILTFILLILALVQCSSANIRNTDKIISVNEDTTKKKPMEIVKTDEEWRKQLTPAEYNVLRQKGTERPFSGEYENMWDSGIYVCKGCGTELFRSETKFDAGCGWPSFYQGIDSTKIIERADNSAGMHRVEVLCARCGGHLGHVFTDGYGTPTGLRYCINSVSLGFRKKE